MTHALVSSCRSTVFKICSQFSEIAIFQKIVRKTLSTKNVNFLGVFQCGAASCPHAHTEHVENLVNEKSFLKKKQKQKTTKYN